MAGRKLVLRVILRRELKYPLFHWNQLQVPITFRCQANPGLGQDGKREGGGVEKDCSGNERERWKALGKRNL